MSATTARCSSNPQGSYIGSSLPTYTSAARQPDQHREIRAPHILGGRGVGRYVAGEGVADAEGEAPAAVADAEGEAPEAPAGAADPVTWITPFMFGAWMVQR